MILPLEHLLLFGSVLFVIGIYGAVMRRNIIGILISIELILNAVNVNLVAFSRTTSSSPETGQVFAIFVIAIAAVEATVGLALVLALFRIRKTIFSDEINLMKW